MSKHHRARGMNGRAWMRLRAAILEEVGHQCEVCGSDGDGAPLNIDHIKGLAQGGTNDRANLRCVCFRCHVRKEWTPQQTAWDTLIEGL